MIEILYWILQNSPNLINHFKNLQIFNCSKVLNLKSSLNENLSLTFVQFHKNFPPLDYFDP